MTGDAAATIRRTIGLTPAETETVRTLLWAAFDSSNPDDAMTEADWQHALGGTHFLLEVDGRIAGHAAVVERSINVGGHPLRAGYVEAVAIAPERQRRGLGSVLMGTVNEDVRERFEIGALGTGVHAFYLGLGWEVWRGPTFVRAPGGLERTADEDGYILVLRTPSSPPLDLDAPISCDWRPGDVW